MKKSFIVLLAVILVLGVSANSYASDWDKAGKALAVVEGVRILTGGNVDVVGRLTGINANGYSFYGRNSHSRRTEVCNRRKRYARAPEKVWVEPQIVWKKEYIPEHRKYDPEYGNIIVEAHYIRYKVEEPGYWVYER